MPKGIYERTKKHRESMSKAKIGKKRVPHTVETKRKIGLGNKGKRRTPEQIQNIKDGLPKNRKLSQKHKNRLSECMRGKPSRNWKGGRYVQDGYIFVWIPSHPSAKKGYVSEHRLMVEQHIGRYLTSKEIVHHIGEKNDNRITQLILFKNCGYHLQHHRNGFNNGIIFDSRLT